MKLRALYDVVFIEPISVTPKTGLIEAPATSQDSRHYGKILAIGFNRLKDGSKISALVGAKPGDTVYYSRAGMWELVIDGRHIVCGKPGYVQALIYGEVEARLEDRSMKAFV